MLRRFLFTIAFGLAACGTGAKRPSRDVVRACETMTACGYESDFAVCIDGLADLANSTARYGTAGLGPSELACLGRAGDDCDAAERCFNMGAPVTDCGTPMTLTSSCDGEIDRACVSGRTRAFDCSSVGLHCITASGGFGECAAAACGAQAGSGCTDSTTLASCQGGVETRLDCSIDGGGCVADTSGSAWRCGGAGAACSSPDHCDHDTLVRCDGHESRVDCAARGLRCVVFADGFTDCANGNTCNEHDEASCAPDGKISYCYLGLPLVTDCIADGFTGCSASGCVR